MKLRTSGQDFVEPGECIGIEILLRQVTPGERMRTFDRPIDVVRNMVKELISGSCFEMGEDLADCRQK